ncbi:MAG: ATP-dependent Clp protease proteolytic subunit [Gemmatimonadetes bacterium]|nr:ATP-dependent Clp protease proteolytic subunit [Gemmatimonadota bacterium]
MTKHMRWGLFAGCVALATAAATMSCGDSRAQQAADAGAVFRIPVNGVIERGLAPFIARSLREAGAAGARAAILDIETPGGRVDAAQMIVDAIKDATVPVYAFVNRRAFSAGALIALATREIWMRPGSVIGAATPVTGEGQKAPEKIVSAMRSEMRALAEDRGLDPRIAEAMVDEEIEIEGVVERGKLLTLTTEEAVRVGYAREVEDFESLLGELELADAGVRSTEVNWAESLVRFLTHPAVAPLLLSIGMLGVLIEIKTPAFGLAGLAGLSSLALFFGGHWLVGLAGLEELMLLGAGLALLLVEAFVLPGFGIAGFAGILAVGSSLYLSMVSNLSTAADLSMAAGVIALAGVVVVVVGWALIRAIPGSGRFARSGLLLDAATSREGGYSSSVARAELMGATGEAITDLRPSGTVQIGDERIDVIAESTWIKSGTTVRVLRYDGSSYVVRAVAPVPEAGD